jgi:DNA-binding NtrC family response regulator
MATVVLVESDAAECDRFTSAVGAEHRVIAVGALDEAWAQLSTAHLLVIGLEQGEGADLTVLDRVRAVHPGLPVVITAPATLHGWQLLRSGMRLGAHEFLTKPFDAAEVRQTVSLTLSSHQPEPSL